MTKWQRINSVLVGIFMIMLALLVLYEKSQSYATVMGCCVVVLFFKGIGQLLYYYTMAKYMTGGRVVFYIGILLTDLALLTFSLVNVPRIYIVSYLASLLVLAGAAEVMKSLDAKRLGGKWHLRMFMGVGTLAAAVLIIYFRNRPTLAGNTFALALIYYGVIHIINAFRETDVIAIV